MQISLSWQSLEPPARASGRGGVGGHWKRTFTHSAAWGKCYLLAGTPQSRVPHHSGQQPPHPGPPSGPGLNTLACLVAGTPVLAQAGGPSALATPATPTTVFPAAPVPHGQPLPRGPPPTPPLRWASFSCPCVLSAHSTWVLGCLCQGWEVTGRAHFFCQDSP